MKQSFIIIALVFSTLTSISQTQSVQPSRKAATSYLYIFRGGQFGAALANYAIFVDGKKICKLSNDKFFKIAVTPGNHEIEAKLGGASIMKKETSIVIVTEDGKDNYISCTVKRSITRTRLEMLEVMPTTGKKEISDMKEDNCQGEKD